MALFTEITFLEVSMALLTLGLIERALLRFAPDEMVGPDGWLLQTDEAE